MIQATYQELVERIARLSGLTADEVKRKIEAKRAKLSGLISLEGAAQIVASELGISFEKQKFKIADLLIGMKKIHVIGKVLEVYPIKKYLKAGHEGEIATMKIADNSSSIRVVLWDTKHIEMIKNNTIAKDVVVEIKNADVRGTIAKELHLSSNSSIELSSEKIEAVVVTEALPLKKISEIKSGERIALRAHIVQAFQPKFFFVCPECSMKISYENEKAFCPKHGIIVPKQRALASLIIDDGTDNIRAVIFDELLAKLFKIQENEIKKLQDTTFWLQKKQEFLGAEMEFSGRVRKNVAFDRNEFVIDSIEELAPEQLIEELS